MILSACEEIALAMFLFSEKVKVKFRLAFPCGLLLIPQAPGPQDFRAGVIAERPKANLLEARILKPC